MLDKIKILNIASLKQSQLIQCLEKKIANLFNIDILMRLDNSFSNQSTIASQVAVFAITNQIFKFLDINFLSISISIPDFKNFKGIEKKNPIAIYLVLYLSKCATLLLATLYQEICQKL